MSSTTNTSTAASDTVGPATPFQLHEYLADLYSSTRQSHLPSRAIPAALEIIRALKDLNATGLLASLRTDRIIITWPFHDVIIEAVLYETGAKNITGRSCTGGIPEVRISTVISAITAAMNLDTFRSMVKELS